MSEFVDSFPSAAQFRHPSCQLTLRELRDIQLTYHLALIRYELETFNRGGPYTTNWMDKELAYELTDILESKGFNVKSIDLDGKEIEDIIQSGSAMDARNIRLEISL